MAIQCERPLPAYFVDGSERVRLGQAIPAVVSLLPDQHALGERALKHPAHRYLAEFWVIIEPAANVRMYTGEPGFGDSGRLTDRRDGY